MRVKFRNFLRRILCRPPVYLTTEELFPGLRRSEAERQKAWNTLTPERRQELLGAMCLAVRTHSSTGTASPAGTAPPRPGRAR